MDAARPFIQQLPAAAPAPVLALGAYLKNRICWLHGTQVHWSALHGDLGDPAACEALHDSARAMLAAAPARPAAIAHDLHPDFHSTRLAMALADELGVPAIAVQHHRAHIAAALAEHGHTQAALGIALDGVGYGLDGSAWGGEVLSIASYDAGSSGDAMGRPSRGWDRVAHLPTLALPGADAATREPWRVAAAALHALGRGAEIVPRFGRQAGQAAASTVRAMLAQNLRCPPSSAAGRWFDAAAAALGVHEGAQAEAEAARAFEAEALRYDPSAGEALQGEPDLLAAVAGCFDAPAAKRPAAAWRFHAVLATCVTGPAARRTRALGVETVALGGGCFHNRVLGPMIRARLGEAGLDVRMPREFDCGDAAIALGQAWVAAGVVSGHDRR